MHGFDFFSSLPKISIVEVHGEINGPIPKDDGCNRLPPGKLSYWLELDGIILSFAIVTIMKTKGLL